MSSSTQVSVNRHSSYIALAAFVLVTMATIYLIVVEVVPVPASATLGYFDQNPAAVAVVAGVLAALAIFAMDYVSRFFIFMAFTTTVVAGFVYFGHVPALMGPWTPLIYLWAQALLMGSILTVLPRPK